MIGEPPEPIQNVPPEAAEIGRLITDNARGADKSRGRVSCFIAPFLLALRAIFLRQPDKSSTSKRRKMHSLVFATEPIVVIKVVLQLRAGADW